jgi:trk system potassium uptake protein TrkA
MNEDPQSVVEYSEEAVRSTGRMGIVVGCGEVGASVCAALAARGCSVVVVDRDPAAFDRLPRTLSVNRVVGDAGNSLTLRRAGLDRANGLFLTTKDEALNLAVAEIARAGSGVPRVLVRVSDPAKRQLSISVGARTIDPVGLATEAFLSAFEEGAAARPGRRR